MELGDFLIRDVYIVEDAHKPKEYSCNNDESKNGVLAISVQGDTSRWSKPPLDTKTKVAFL